MSNLKLGITLYCFTKEYAEGKFDVFDCLKTAAEIGAKGFEIVGAQMVKGYPYVDDRFLGELSAAAREYGLEPICYGANTDRGMLKNRDLTEQETLQRAILDLKTANKLGCKVMRAQYLLSPNAMEKLAPYAEEYGIKVGIEIHNPETPTTPIMQEYLEAFERTGSAYVGFVPDFGSFATKPNKPFWDLAVGQGAPVKLLEKAADLRYQDVPRDEARQILIEAGAGPEVLTAFENMYGFVTFYKNPDLAGLKKILPYCVHFHGKFHYVGEDLTEASIPYEQILPIIADSTFDGYIMSEFEGHNFYDAVEMTKRHLLMEKKILESLQ
ncbi:sugar phosphate isomerase/epimerase family protein [Listeria costaricensis]|uniref:sugar phosphate isomerase/epimerase family protein n=1 Tax=Listeria costaricensis TaxID=2026604 RepID=UPI000C06A414|nr:TIM barrel protein [Listeria costaricensis]